MNNWRAIAHLKNGKEALVVLGQSQYQVTNAYQEAFLEVVHPDLHATCSGISLQQWRGKPERGYWKTVGTLRMPGC
jgi:hypothetical protein